MKTSIAIAAAEQAYVRASKKPLPAVASDRLSRDDLAAAVRKHGWNAKRKPSWRRA